MVVFSEMVTAGELREKLLLVPADTIVLLEVFGDGAVHADAMRQFRLDQPPLDLGDRRTVVLSGESA
jgi:hypothetical protein